MVVILRMGKYEIRRVLMDTSTLVNLIILDIFIKLGLKQKDLVKVSYPLIDLGYKTVVVLGTINLTLALGDEEHKCVIYAKFVVIDIHFAYNIILGRLFLNSPDIIVNMGYLCMKLSTPSGIEIVKEIQMSVWKSYRHSTKGMSKSTMPINFLKKK